MWGNKRQNCGGPQQPVQPLNNVQGQSAYIPVPVCGGNEVQQVVIPLPMSGQTFNCPVEVERIVEPAINCAPNVYNHFRRVEHVVPIIQTNVHNWHTQHDFVGAEQVFVQNVESGDITVAQPAYNAVAPAGMAPADWGQNPWNGVQGANAAANNPCVPAAPMAPAPMAPAQGLPYNGIQGLNTQGPAPVPNQCPPRPCCGFRR